MATAADIMAKLDELVSKVDNLTARVEALAKARPAGASAAPRATKPITRDDIGGPRDWEAKFNPRDWKGDSLKGLRFSECPADGLDEYARSLDYFASKAKDGPEKAAKDADAAALVRAWAEFRRANPMTVGDAPADEDDSSIPF